MPDDSAPDAADRTAPAPDHAGRTAAPPVPGDRPPRRLLDHPPSDRYLADGVAPTAGGSAGSPSGDAGSADRAGSPTRAVLLGSLVAAAAAAAHLVAAVALDWTGGLLFVAATAGLATGLAVRLGGGMATGAGKRRLAAVLLALAAVAGALVLNWVVSPRYLAPTDYLDQVYGTLVPLQIALAAAGALVGSR